MQAPLPQSQSEIPGRRCSIQNQAHLVLQIPGHTLHRNLDEAGDVGQGPGTLDPLGITSRVANYPAPKIIPPYLVIEFLMGVPMKPQIRPLDELGEVVDEVGNNVVRLPLGGHGLAMGPEMGDHHATAAVFQSLI